MKMNKISLSISTALLAAGFMTSSAVNAQGRLVVYCSATNILCETTTKAFGEKYDVKTSFIRNGSGSTFAKVEAEKNNPQADVWFGGTFDPQAQAAELGLLESYRSPLQKDIMPQFKSLMEQRGNFTSVIYLMELGIGVNTKKLKELNVDILRAGTFKGRTSPYAFQGLREEGVEILIDIGKKYNIPVVTELTSIEQVKKYGNKLDIIQIGTRNMYNYELLKEVGKLKTPVILKRGLSATYNEWLLAAEYIKNAGNDNIILCERGIRGFDPTTRNILDIAAVPYIKKNTSYPIIVDPSHATGTRYMIRPLSIASIAAGADGIMVEAHIRPEKSLSDARQTINISTLKDIISDINKYQNI